MQSLLTSLTQFYPLSEWTRYGVSLIVCVRHFQFFLRFVCLGWFRHIVIAWHIQIHANKRKAKTRNHFYLPILLLVCRLISQRMRFSSSFHSHRFLEVYRMPRALCVCVCACGRLNANLHEFYLPKRNQQNSNWMEYNFLVDFVWIISKINCQIKNDVEICEKQKNYSKLIDRIWIETRAHLSSFIYFWRFFSQSISVATVQTDNRQK